VSGDIHLAKDDLAGAASSYAESLEIRKQLGDKSMIAASELSLAALAVEQGELDKSFAMARQAAQQLRDLGDTEEEAVARNLLAKILLLQKNPSASQVELDAVRKLGVKDRSTLVATDIASSQLLSQQAKGGDAVRLLSRVLERLEPTNNLLGQMQVRIALADIRIVSGESERAGKDLLLLQDESAKLGFKLLQRRSEELLKKIPMNRAL
jgi:hypothetical protein